MRSDELTKSYLREYRICSQRPGIRIHELVVECTFASSERLRPSDLPTTAQVFIPVPACAADKINDGSLPATSRKFFSKRNPDRQNRNEFQIGKARHLVETAGLYLVAGARFELTTFRL